jgi:hypothetical protein
MPASVAVTDIASHANQQAINEVCSYQTSTLYRNGLMTAGGSFLETLERCSDDLTAGASGGSISSCGGNHSSVRVRLFDMASPGPFKLRVPSPDHLN